MSNQSHGDCEILKDKNILFRVLSSSLPRRFGFLWFIGDFRRFSEIFILSDTCDQANKKSHLTCSYRLKILLWRLCQRYKLAIYNLWFKWRQLLHEQHWNPARWHSTLRYESFACRWPRVQHAIYSLVHGWNNISTYNSKHAIPSQCYSSTNDKTFKGIIRNFWQKNAFCFHQKLALKTLTSMTSLLSSKTTEDYASEYVLVEEGGENLVLGLGNLLHSTAQKADVVGQTKEPTDVRSKVSFELTESVCVPSQKNVTDVMITITFSWEPDQKVKYIFLEQVKPWHLQAFFKSNITEWKHLQRHGETHWWRCNSSVVKDDSGSRTSPY